MPGEYQSDIVDGDTLEKRYNIVFYFNDLCDNDVRANSKEGWVEVIVYCISRGKTIYNPGINKDGQAAKCKMYGDVKIIAVSPHDGELILK